MVSIKDDKIEYLWLNELIVDRSVAESLLYSKKMDDKSIENNTLSKYDTIFFNNEIEKAVRELAKIFMKYNLLLPKSLFYNRDGYYEGKVSGLAIDIYVDALGNQLYDMIVVDTIDDFAFQYIIEYVVNVWAEMGDVDYVAIKTKEQLANISENIENLIVQIKNSRYRRSFTVS
ncbi:MAG: hypothetical protein R3Y50_05245 [Rikenellaceae bacterium]